MFEFITQQVGQNISDIFTAGDMQKSYAMEVVQFFHCLL